MTRNAAALRPKHADDFQHAVITAEASQLAWCELSLAEQSRAIYTQLRELDIARAKAIAFTPDHRPRRSKPPPPIQRR